MIVRHGAGGSAKRAAAADIEDERHELKALQIRLTAARKLVRRAGGVAERAVVIEW